MKASVWRAKRYRERAEELRVVAEATKNSEARNILLTLADDYVRMADAVEARDQSSEQPYEHAETG